MNTEIIFASGVRLVVARPIGAVADLLFADGSARAVEISAMGKGTVVVNPAAVAYLATTTLA